jgi:hypothetical protein
LLKAIAESPELVGWAKFWFVNFQKRLLEASKISAGIDAVKDALERGRYPILFVETKAERIIDIPYLFNQEALYMQEVAFARAGKGQETEIPSRKEFGLPPEGVVPILDLFSQYTSIYVIEIPSAEDVVKDAFPDQVAIFTGSVTPKKAQENLDAWRKGSNPVLVATMAKGGTGLSLHDRKGDHPTTQINVNLPWTATQVAQVAQRSARYGLQSRAEMMWLFTDDIIFDQTLALRVGGRMADMGAIVTGEDVAQAQFLQDWNFEDAPFSEQQKPADKVETPADFIDDTGTPVKPATDSRANRMREKLKRGKS